MNHEPAKLKDQEFIWLFITQTIKQLFILKVLSSHVKEDQR